jgi:hypothetical protein
MRPNRQQIFRTDAADKLDRLELIAALLERDATNNRAFIAEISSVYPHGRGKPRAQPFGKLRKLAVDTYAAGVRIVSTTVAIARSRQVRTAIRAVFAFAVDFGIVMSVACTAVAILAAAFLLTAPPV